LLIDPFNYVDLPVMSGATDTQKISMVLKQIVAFARTYKVLVIVVAHPRKPQTDGRDKQGLSSVPSLYDIAGSADFYNKCDYGIILQREKPTDNQKRLPLTWIHVQKVRFRHLGQIGRRAFGFDPTSGRFVGTENDNMTLKPYDRSDWSYIEAEQQDIEWPDDDDPEAETAEDDLPF
jgi:twinkle protein